MPKRLIFFVNSPPPEQQKILSPLHPSLSLIQRRDIHEIRGSSVFYKMLLDTRIYQSKDKVKQSPQARISERRDPMRD
jgi:hypothetical protein